jgi:glycosyltransferase involved in cell wall biosynthesis
MSTIGLANVGFSIVIPTRNRVELLERAIDSIVNQTYQNLEIIIVDDGSSNDTRAKLSKLISSINSVSINLLLLPSRKNGHGPSFSRNTGANAAKFDYIAFLDDDDELIAKSYFETVANKLCGSATTADLILSNQIAVTPSKQQHTENIWLEKYLINGPFLKLSEDDVVSLPSNFFDNILEFAHINTIIVTKELFNQIDGFDEAIRYEEDRDLFYRLISSAKNIWATGITNAKHYIPKQRDSASSIHLIEKLRLQSIVYSKSILYTDNPQRLKLIVCQLGFIYRKHVAHFLAKGEYRKAIIYAKLSTSLKFNLKWFLYTKYLKFKELINLGNQD